jgi:two-component sensor histidine kinase
LGTNAAKHGSLSVADGRVKVRWSTEEPDKNSFRLTWEEFDGPAVAQPQRQGFGVLVITKVVPKALLGTASADFEPQGFRWVLESPAKIVLA